MSTDSLTVEGQELGSAETTPDAPRPRSAAPWRQALHRFRRRRSAMVALLVLLAYGLIAIFADRIAPYPAGHLFPELVSYPKAPSLHGGHLLGTDPLGYDILSQLMFAIRESIEWGLVTMLGATTIGVALGALAGYLGGAFDFGVSWLTGVVVTMPAFAVLLLVATLAAPLAPFWFSVALIFCLWTGVARVVRGNFASLRNREFVEAAYAAGASPRRVVFRHLLPNSFGPVLIAATAIIGQSIILIATVDYFAWGNENYAHPTLGGMVAEPLKATLIIVPWWEYTIPTVVLCVLLVCLNVTVDSLDDALNPRRRR